MQETKKPQMKPENEAEITILLRCQQELNDWLYWPVKQAKKYFSVLKVLKFTSILAATVS